MIHDWRHIYPLSSALLVPRFFHMKSCILWKYSILLPNLFVGCKLGWYSTWVTFRMKEHVGVMVGLVSAIVSKHLDVLA